MEKGGDNKGEIVSLFQMAVDGKAIGEAWCMSFVQSCVKKTDEIIDSIFQQTFKERTSLFPSEHCLTVWDNKAPGSRLERPGLGAVVIWQHGDTRAGHTGIVASVNPSQGIMWTIEGNTGLSKAIVRQGDGVYLKRREIAPRGPMRIVGFISPWLASASLPSISLH